MNTEKFTQDEWTVAYNGNIVFVVVKGTESENIPDVICSAGLNSHAHRANAHFIASAPEMYRKLVELREALSSVPILQKDIDEVLKKARGEYEQ